MKKKNVPIVEVLDENGNLLVRFNGKDSKMFLDICEKTGKSYEEVFRIITKSCYKSVFGEEMED